MAKLIEGFVSRLSVPAGEREVVVYDDSLPGFGVRKFASGKASYVLKYRVSGKQRKFTLGPVVSGNLAEMRHAAGQVLAKAKLGQDLAAEIKAAASVTTASVGELVPRYLKFKKDAVVPEYHYQLTLFLERYWQPLHKREIKAVTRGEIVTLLDRLADEHGKVSADRAKAALSGLFAWAIERSYLDLSPVQGIKKRATAGARERVLTEAELVAVWKACGDYDYARIVRLLILTGQRRDEIGDLEWPEIDVDKRLIVLPGRRTKNKRPHLVPLSDAALAILKEVPKRKGRSYLFGEGAVGFQGWSKAKSTLDERLPAEMPAWTIHDIRRSVSTHLAELGFAEPHVIEAALNHASGSKAGVAGTYNRAVYLKERTQALDLWGDHIDALVTGRKGKLLALRR